MARIDIHASRERRRRRLRGTAALVAACLAAAALALGRSPVHSMDVAREAEAEENNFLDLDWDTVEDGGPDVGNGDLGGANQQEAQQEQLEQQLDQQQGAPQEPDALEQQQQQPAGGGAQPAAAAATAAGAAAAAEPPRWVAGGDAAAAAAIPLGDARAAMLARACGSPAVDGYAHITPECMMASPTARWWAANKPRPEDLRVHIDRHADYDGIAVGWGIGNKKASVEECARACLEHVPNSDGPFTRLPCNAFSWCGEDVCFEPDAHTHTRGDCWLKFTEAPAAPEVNMRGALPPDVRARHPTAPEVVPWHAGAVLPAGVALTNGTWGPRSVW